MSFGRTFSFSLLIAAACHWHFAVTAVGIGDIFNLGDNCASYQADLDTIYTEALELLTSATRAVDDGSNMLSANWEEAWRLMFTFFHDPSASDYTQIRRWYTDVQSFLNNGFTSGDKPWLFCGDDWAIRQTMSDQMYSSDGKPATETDGSVYRISDNPAFVQFQQESTTTVGKTTYPYWSKQAGGYMFMQDFGQTDPTKGACTQVITDDQGNDYVRRGATSSVNRVMILCPTSFVGTNLRATAPSCIAASLYGTKPKPAAAQRLMDIAPRVYTFFHELFHLVEGNAATVPAGGEEYNVKTMLDASFTKAQALANPETYTMVAVGYDYTLNTAAINGHLIEYYTGYCTWDDGTP